METRIALNGIHSTSDILVQEILNYKYGRTKDKQRVQSKFEEEINSLYNFQKKLGIARVHTGSLAHEDLIRPFTVHLESFHSFLDIGELPIRRWSSTNFFYREPTLIKPFPEEPIVVKQSKNDLYNTSFFLTEYMKANEEYRVQFPGVVTFGLMTRHDEAIQKGIYKDMKEYFIAIGDYLGKEIASLPTNCTEIQLDDPMILWKNVPRTHYQAIIQAYQSIKEQNPNRTLIINTFFANALKFLKLLLQLPVDGVGIDLWFTNPMELVKYSFHGKILQLGLLNAKNYFPKNDVKRQRMKEFWVHIIRGMKRTDANSLVITPNTGMHFLPRKEADEMVRLLVEAVKE